MHRDRNPGLFLIVVKPVVNLLDIIVFAGECLAGDGHHADRVFIYVLVKVLSGKTVVASLQGHNPRLDIEIAQELFPDNLDVAAGYHVWPTNIFSSLLSSLPPIPLVGQTAQHTRLGRTDSRSSVRLRVDSVCCLCGYMSG